jgi:oligopeptide transport system substrate-binding protein
VIRASRMVAISLTLALLPTACSPGGEGAKSQSGKALTIAIADEPVKYINPANENGSSGLEVVEAMFAPLVEADPDTGKIRNVVAESVTPDATGQVWTIKIKDGFTFHNGQPLTAKDYVDTWNLTALGSNAWKNNGYFAKVEGYEALNPKEGAKPTATELTGLKVVDDHTFTVRLNYPFSQFGLTLQYSGLAPLAAEVRKDPTAYERKQIGMGPYKLEGEWKVGEDIKLVKWPDFRGTAPDADRITFKFIPNADTAYNEFLAGNLDIVPVPSTKQSSFKTDAPDQWLISENAGNIFYWAFPTYDPTFSNPKIRRAFSLAIDRKALANLVGIAKPATGLVPPGIDGARSDSCTACIFDPAAAKKLFDEAGGLSEPVPIYYSTSAATGQTNAEALGNMIRQHLGVQVRYVGKQGSEITELGEKKKIDGMRSGGWVHDYPSIENYLTPVLKSTGDANFASYSNPKFDELLSQGDAEADQAKALALYRQAEDIALQDMPLIPLFHRQDAFLAAKGVHPRNSQYTGVSKMWSRIDR